MNELENILVYIGEASSTREMQEALDNHKAKWLVVALGKTHEYKSLARAAKRSGREAHLASLKDIYVDNIPYKKGDGLVVAHGSISTIQYLEKEWGFANFTPWEELTCSKYYGNLGKYITQQDYTMLPLGEIYRKWNELLEKYGEDNCVFIRPDSNAKPFTAFIVGEVELNDLKIAEYDLDMLCVVARPLVIEKEWRVFIHRNEVITGSLYKPTKTKSLPRNVKKFCEQIIKEAYNGLPSLYYLDIAQVDGKLSLLEISGFNCAGFYKCDLNKIVKAVNQETESFLRFLE